MKTLSFACPECNNRFSFKVDYVPDGCAIVRICPFCNERVELTPGDVVDEPSCIIVDFNALKRAKVIKIKT